MSGGRKDRQLPPDELLLNRSGDTGAEDLPVFSIDKESSISDLHALLDTSVKGQDTGKWNLSVLLSLHLATYHEDDKRNPTPNAILCGPTGVGKTHSMRTIANDFALPLVLVDTTSLVPSGIIGMQIEDVMELLYDNAKRILTSGGYRSEPEDVRRLAERGVVFLDEFDKIATPAAEESSNDSTRRQTQRRLLKLVEGSQVAVGVKSHTYNRQKDVYLDTSKLLVIAGGAFADIAQRTSGRRSNSELYRELFPNRTIVAEDIRLYGFLPELVARFPLIIEYSPLTPRDLVHILAQSPESPLRLWEHYASLTGYQLVVDPEALALIAALAVKLDVGARGLQQLLFPYMSQRFLDAARAGNEKIHIRADDFRPAGVLYLDRGTPLGSNPKG